MADEEERRLKIEADRLSWEIQDKGLSRRAAIDQDTFRGLMAMNGGGVVALLTFFGNVFGKSKSAWFEIGITVGLACFATGLALAIRHNMNRRKCDLAWTVFNDNNRVGEYPEKCAACVDEKRNIEWSIRFFFIGVVFVVIGAVADYGLGPLLNSAASGAESNVNSVEPEPGPGPGPEITQSNSSTSPSTRACVPTKNLIRA